MYGSMGILCGLWRYHFGLICLSVFNIVLSLTIFSTMFTGHFSVEIFCIAIAALFLSMIVYRIIVYKRTKKKVFEDLRAVKYEDFPLLMVTLLERIKKRKMLSKQNATTKAHDKTCVACYEMPASIENLPCKHVVLCSVCNWNFIRVSIENQTPLLCSWCRTPIKDFDGEMRPSLDHVDWQDIGEALIQLKCKKFNKISNRSMANQINN